MIVALHGFTGAPSQWSGFPARALCLVGHGKDAVASGGETFLSEVDRLAALLPEGGTHLVGYSLGGRLSLAIALQHPDKVQRLSLISASPGLDSEEDRKARRKADEGWIELLESEGIEAFARRWQALPLWNSQALVDDERMQEQRARRLQHDPRQLALALRALGTGVMPPLWHRLDELRMPTSLIAGALDSKFVAIAADMKERMPTAALHILDDCGHNPLLECPDALGELLGAPALAPTSLLSSPAGVHP